MKGKDNILKRAICRLPLISHILQTKAEVEKLNQQFSQLRERVWPRRELFKPGERDFYLVSYPRSGNTWLRVILAEVLYQASGNSMKELNYYAPDIHVRTYQDEVINSDFHLVKSHFRYLILDPEMSKYKNIIYLIRDPRDIVLSFFNYNQKLRNYRFDFEQFLLDFLEGRIAPCSWQEHVRSWTADLPAQAGLRVQIVRYEDLFCDIHQETAKLLRFLQVEAKDEQIQRAVACASVERMREKEQKGMRRSEQATDFHFIGPAAAKQWQEKLTPRHLALIKQYAGEVMQKFGYEL